MGESPIFLILGLATALLGLVLAIIADRLPVNPLFGFRIGPTYSSRRLWVKYNRIAGLSLLLIGLVVASASIYTDSTVVLASITLVLVVSDTLILALTASREAERVLGEEAYEAEERIGGGGSVRRIEPIPPSPLRSLLLFTPPLASILTIYLYAPLLPQIIPVHFDLSGNPDSWQPLGVFISVTLPLLMGLELIGPIMFLVEIRNPFIFYKPGIPKNVVTNMVYDLAAMVEILIYISLTDILYYAVYHSHPLGYPVITASTILLIAALIVRPLPAYMLWRRAYTG